MPQSSLEFGKAIAFQNKLLPSATCFKNSRLSSPWGKCWPRILAFALMCALCASSFAGDLTVPQPKMPQITEIPFRLHQGYLIVVEGRLGNLEHQNLLVDTGTSPSIIDIQVSSKLSLRGAPRSIALFNKDLSAETVILPDIQVGPLHRSNLSVMVEDFSKIAREVGTHVDAVIGLDVLGAMNFTIDYQKNRILFHASAERHSANFTAGPQFITLNLNTGGKELHVLLDTGTPRLVLFRNALHDLDYDWSQVTGAGENMSGTVSYRTVVLSRVKLGREDVGPQAASVVTSQRTVDSHCDGLIGVALLRPKQLSFDFDRQVLGWSN